MINDRTHANVTYTMENGILRQWVSVAPTPKMKQPFYIAFEMS
jgi:hypothetical protein